MKSFEKLISAGIASVLLVDCSHRDNEVVGKWKDPFGTIFTLAADNTFKRVNKSGTASGTWIVEGDKVKTTVDKVNAESFSAKAEKEFKEARAMLPPDYVALHSKAQFLLSLDGHTMTHKNSTTQKDVPYTKL